MPKMENTFLWSRKSGGTSEWGEITGDIENQTDLANALTIQTQDINQNQEDINNLYTLISNNPSLLTTPLSQATPAPNLTFTFPTSLIPNEYDYVAFLWNYLNIFGGIFLNQNTITIPKALDGSNFVVNIQGVDYEATCTPTTLTIIGAPSPQLGTWAIRKLYRSIPIDIANLVFLKGDDKCIILEEAFKNNSTILKRYAFKSSLGYTYYFEDIDTLNTSFFKWITVRETYYGITNTCKVHLLNQINFNSTIDFMMNSVISQLRNPKYAMKKGQLYTGMLMSEWKDTVRDLDDPYVWWDANANSRYIHINLMRKVGSTYQVQLDANANKDDNETSNVGRLFTRTITTTIAISDTTTLANIIQNITDIAYDNKSLLYNQNSISTLKQYVFTANIPSTTSNTTPSTVNLKTLMDTTNPGLFDDWVANKNKYIIQTFFQDKSEDDNFGFSLYSGGITSSATYGNLFSANVLSRSPKKDLVDGTNVYGQFFGNINGDIYFNVKYDTTWNANFKILVLLILQLYN